MKNNMQVDFQVVQLLCSRMCHDLAGPAGAIHNGMELLEETGEDGGALDLVAASVGQLNGRLGFYRLAFGLGGLSGRKPALNEARDLTVAFLKGGRATINWPEFSASATDPGFDPKLVANSAKVLLNLALFVADSMPRGDVIDGKLSLTAEDPVRVELLVKGGGLGAFIKDERKAAFDREGLSDVALTAHNVQVFFMRRLVEGMGGQIEIADSTDAVQVTAFLKV